MSVRRLLDVLLVAAVAGAAGGPGFGSGLFQEPPNRPGGQPPGQQGEAGKEEAPPEPVVLDRQDTANLVATWTGAEHWTVRGLVIVSLGESWSPEAAPMLMEALTGKRKELAAFALERLKKANDMCLSSTVTAPMVRHLIDEVLADRDEYVSGVAQTLLVRLFPDANCDKRSKWQTYWRGIEETYAPQPWVAPPPKPTDGP
jgi:hypothetical protein